MPNYHQLAWLFRLWTYFRQGYNTYVSFAIGAVNILVVVWYLAIKDIPFVEQIFAHFYLFAIAFILAVGTMGVGLGWAHFKRLPAFSADNDITVESNIYNYRLTPGYTREIYGPLCLFTVKAMKRSHMFNVEEQRTLDDLEQKLGTLLQGGTVGNPRMKVHH